MLGIVSENTLLTYSATAGVSIRCHRLEGSGWEGDV